MHNDDTTSPPDALMLMGTRCPYCPGVLKALQALVESGHIGQLETHVIEENPEIARELGVRSVPWVRIGPFELEGLRSEKELREWAEKAATGGDLTDWLNEQLGNGNIDAAVAKIRADRTGMDALLTLFTDPDTPLNIHIGISAIMEELQGSDLLREHIDQLGALTRHDEARVRGDACHFLSLAGDQQAIGYIKPLLTDTDANVRELAQDSLTTLGG
ncbi:MAG: HEAT repeat domain-containing protein [Nitrospirae bacterium]|nr:HEAT repeat domain-containing protein [Nitrospirota bacterium]